MEEKRMSVESPPETLLGSGFRPKDEEIVHYLRLKKAGKNSQVDNAIAEVDFYKSLPWDLPHKARLNSDDRTWHFFHRQVHMGNKRIKRKTPTGTWKVTGNDRKIKDRNGKVIGSKRYFVFLPDGARRDRRTEWFMHEYSEPSDPLTGQTSYVVCRLEERMNKKSNTPDHDENGPTGGVASDLPAVPAATTWEHGPSEDNHGLLKQPYAPNSDGGTPSIGFTSCMENLVTSSEISLLTDEIFIKFLQSDIYNDGPNESEGSCGVPDENVCGQEVHSPFNDYSQVMSMKRNYSLVAVDAIGVSGQVGPRSLALGDSISNS